MDKITFINTPLGLMKARINQDSLLGFSFATEAEYEDCQKNQEQVEYSKEQEDLLKMLSDWCQSYFEGAKVPVTFPLKPIGTDFQLKVWEAVAKIPFGETCSYKELSEHVAVQSAQAVGQALAANPILLCIPCHRVIKTDGSLGGYVGGVERKKKLLQLEKKMYTFYEYPKCTTCRRAKAELNELGWDYEAIDIKTNPPKAEQLEEWIKSSGLDIKKFFNTSGQKYRELGLKDKVTDLSIEEASQILASDGMLIKRPLLIKDNQIVQIGHRTEYKARS